MKESNLYDKLTKYGETLLLWILCTTCSSAVACIYLSTVLNFYSLLAAVMSAAVILFLDFARKKKKLGGLLYMAALTCVSFIPSLTITERYDIFNFVRWFFSGSEAVETKTNYIFTLTVLVCFLFTSAAYYFTKVIYRSSIMTLITLIPFALAVKTVTNLPYGYVAAAAAANLLIFIYKERKAMLEGSKPQGRAAFMVYADFAIAVILLALILPKPSVTPYYEKFEAMANRFQFGGSGETQYTGEYKDISGRADELRRGESVLIYLVSTQNPVYVKTQTFDVFDYEQGGWVALEKMTGSKKWQETAPLLSFEKLGDAVEDTVKNFEYVKELYPQAESLSGLTETEAYSIVYAREFPAVYVLAPLRATSVNLSNIRASYSARTDNGEMFTDLSLIPGDATYTLRYYTEDMFDRLIAEGFCDVTAEDYGEFLKNSYYLSDMDSDDEAVIGEFLGQYEYAEEYAEKTEMEISAEIQALADELTAGLEYDYQKAQAIEEYFHSGGFVYDLSYSAPAELDTPEYFLFESRRGICSDFATAFSLLAKAAGLTVRYNEGFVMQYSQTTADLYYIYTDNAHAYPEVYIPGAGWMIFEPTPSDITAAGNGADENEENTDPLAAVLTGVVFVVGFGIFILIVIFTPKILEGIFRLRVRNTDGSKAVILLYKRHTANMEQKFGESCKAFTPEQLAEYTESKTALSLEPLTKPFIKACYGAVKTDSEEKLQAFDCYKAQYKAIRKTKKRKE